MDTVRREAAPGRQRGADLARRCMRKSAGQQKAGWRDERSSRQHSRLAAFVALRRSRRASRRTEAKQLTDTDSSPRVTPPHGVRPGGRYVIWMDLLRTAEARDALAGQPAAGCLRVTGEPCRAPRLIDTTMDAVTAGDGIAVANRVHLSPHPPGIAAGSRRPPPSPSTTSAAGRDRTCPTYPHRSSLPVRHRSACPARSPHHVRRSRDSRPFAMIACHGNISLPRMAYSILQQEL